MKTHLVGTCAVVVSGLLFFTPSFADNSNDYLILARHRDSNGHLLAGPTQHQAQPSVIQKTVVPAQAQAYERRNTDWGMNSQEVKMNEPVQPLWELRSPVLEDYEQRVAYRSQIEGINAALTYTFYENKLAQANYLFEPQHDDPVDYVRDFQTVKNWIIRSYGMPVSVQEIWLDDLYHYDKSLWGQAVMRGHLKMVAEWQNDTTHITLILDGGDDTIGLIADFDSVVVVSPASMKASFMEETPSIEEHPPTGVPAMESEPSTGDPSTHADPQEPAPRMAL